MRMAWLRGRPRCLTISAVAQARCPWTLKEIELQDDVVVDVVHEHQVEVVPLARSSILKRRLHGKRPLLNDGPEQPAVYACQGGGEKGIQWSDQQWNEGIMLVQHRMLQDHFKEELVRMQEGQLQPEDVQGLTELKDAETSLEKSLQRVTAERKSEVEKMALRTIHSNIQTIEEGDVLQT